MTCAVPVRQKPGVHELDGGECGAFRRFGSEIGKKIDRSKKKNGHQWKIDLMAKRYLTPHS